MLEKYANHETRADTLVSNVLTYLNQINSSVEGGGKTIAFIKEALNELGHDVGESDDKAVKILAVEVINEIYAEECEKNNKQKERQEDQRVDSINDQKTMEIEQDTVCYTGAHLMHQKIESDYKRIKYDDPQVIDSLEGMGVKPAHMLAQRLFRKNDEAFKKDNNRLAVMLGEAINECVPERGGIYSNDNEKVLILAKKLVIVDRVKDWPEPNSIIFELNSQVRDLDERFDVNAIKDKLKLMKDPLDVGEATAGFVQSALESLGHEVPADDTGFSEGLVGEFNSLLDDIDRTRREEHGVEISPMLEKIANFIGASYGSLSNKSPSIDGPQDVCGEDMVELIEALDPNYMQDNEFLLALALIECVPNIKNRNNNEILSTSRNFLYSSLQQKSWYVDDAVRFGMEDEYGEHISRAHVFADKTAQHLADSEHPFEKSIDEFAKYVARKSLDYYNWSLLGDDEELMEKNGDMINNASNPPSAE